MTTANLYPTRSAWRRAFNRRKDGYARAAERFIEASPHEAPARIRRPHTASEWLALSLDERRAHVRKQAKEFVLGQMPPEPAPRSLTLSQLERLVIEHAERRAGDLRANLKDAPADVEAIVAAQLPAFRAAAFEQLTNTHRIIEG